MPFSIQTLRCTAIATMMVACAARATLALDAMAQLQVIALSGAVPDAAVAAADFARFDTPPVINNAGHVVFRATAQPSANEAPISATSLWKFNGANVSLVASSEMPALTDGHVIANLSIAQFRLDDSSNVLFQVGGHTVPAGGIQFARPDTELWMRSDEGLTRLVGVGQRDSAGDDAYVASLRSTAFSPDGHVSYFGSIAKDRAAEPPQGGLWLGNGAATSLIALTASDAGLADNAVFDSQTFGSPFADMPVVSANGQTVFRGFLGGPHVDVDNSHGIWQYDTDRGLRLLARSGDEMASAPGMTIVSFPQPPSINAAGAVTFDAFLRPTDDNTDSLVSSLDLAVYSTRSGELERVVGLGDAAAGVAGARLVDLGRPIMNGQGNIAIPAVARASDAPDDAVGLWSDAFSDEQAFELVAAAGIHHADGGDTLALTAVLEPAMNLHGQLAFLATYLDDHSSATQPALALLGQDRAGKLRTVIRTGDTLDVSTSDSRVVQSIVFSSGSGGQDGRPRGINDAGLVAFRVRFDDGTSAVLVSDALTVPESSTFVSILVTTFISVAVVALRHWRVCREAIGNS